MADGGPDLQQQLLAMQSLISSSRGGKPAFLFGWLPLECNAAGPLSIANVSPLSKTLPTLSTGKAGGLGDKLLQVVQNMGDDFRKAAQGAGAVYSGSMPAGTPVSSSQLFAANLAATPSSDIGIG